MRTANSKAKSTPISEGEEGQAAISLVLMLGLFLLAVLGFGVDLTNMWFHRQAARAASDAACQAAAMDMVAGSSGLTLTKTGFTPGTDGNCVSSPNSTMCSYAAANGYNGAGLSSSAASNSVTWTWPSSVAGVTSSGPNSFLKVAIQENVRTYFMSMATASNYQTLNTTCTCGIVQVKAAPPMVVLNPTMSGAFTYTGGGLLDIIGGPGRSLQVNSSSPTAVSWGASGLVDLSAGGPNGTGSDVGIVGGPSAVPTNGGSSGYSGGTTGNWKSNVIPVADPYAGVAPPVSQKMVSPALGTAGTWVGYGVDGCPDHSAPAYVQGVAATNCLEFSPGYYPSGLNFPNDYSTMILQPGVYYINGTLTVSGSNTLRMAKPSGYAQTDGLMLYFLSGSINFSGGKSNDNIDNVQTTDLTCDGSAPAAALNMPTSMTGNVLWAQCTTNGTYWDNGGDTTDSRGAPGNRGILIFEDHGNTTQPSFAGSAQLSFSGSLYFHSSTYSDVLALSGGTSTGTYVLGEIIADQVRLTGSGAIRLALNPAATTNMPKAAILQ